MDIYMAYEFVKRLTTPFEEMEAFKLGIIDKDGKNIKKATTKEEKESYTYFDKLIINLKKLMAKVGLSSRMATFAAGMLLLKESREELDKNIQDELELLNALYNEIKELKNEEIANSISGGNIAGADSNPPVNQAKYKKKRKQQDSMRRIDVANFKNNSQP